jgi:hypothetical protein
LPKTTTTVTPTEHAWIIATRLPKYAIFQLEYPTSLRWSILDTNEQPSLTEGSKGAKIILTDLNDPTSPVPALRHHLAANANVPAGAPLFAFETDDGGWEPLTKSNWLARCNKVWVATGFAPLKAHAFRIGSCTELLLRGTNPDIVCVQGRWKSRAFLVYWQKIQKVLPLFISNSFSASCVTLVNSSMSSFRSKFL